MVLGNWKQVNTYEIAEWERSKNKSLVVSYNGSKYEVELKKYSEKFGTYRDVLKSFSEKEDALLYAKRYMETH